MIIEKRSHNFKNIAGQKFGHLLVLDNYIIKSEKKKRRTYWLCRCDCNTEKYLASYRLTSLGQKCCSSTCKYDSRKKAYGEGAFNNLYYRYMNGAQDRKLSFNLTIEQFKDLTKQNCYYCNIEPNQSHRMKTSYGDYIYNGIDRLDNSIGYELTNCVSCCSKCNFMKHKMNSDEFIKQSLKIAEKWKNQ